MSSFLGRTLCNRSLDQLRDRAHLHRRPQLDDFGFAKDRPTISGSGENFPETDALRQNGAWVHYVGIIVGDSCGVAAPVARENMLPAETSRFAQMVIDKAAARKFSRRGSAAAGAKAANCSRCQSGSMFSNTGSPLLCPTQTISPLVR